MLWTEAAWASAAWASAGLRTVRVRVWGCEPSISWLPLLVSVRGRETFVSYGRCASSAAP